MKETLERIIKSKIFFVVILTIITIVIAGLLFKSCLNNLKVTNETETESTINEETTTSKLEEDKTKETTSLREKYMERIKEFTINELELVKDKAILVNAIDGLEEIQLDVNESFEKDELSVLDFEDLDALINGLIDLYNKRIEELETTSEEINEDPTTTTKELETTTKEQNTTTNSSEKETATEKETTKFGIYDDNYEYDEDQTMDPLWNDSEARAERDNPNWWKHDQYKLVYNADGSANLKDSIIGMIIYDKSDEEQTQIRGEIENFIRAIKNNELQNLLSQGHLISYSHRHVYQDIEYSHFDIRDYIISVCHYNYDTGELTFVKDFYVDNNWTLQYYYDSIDQ